MTRRERAGVVRWTIAAITAIALAAIAAKGTSTNEHDVLVAEQHAREVEAQQDTARAWLRDEPDAYERHECRRLAATFNATRAVLFMACQNQED